jgi:D-glycero-D-manno-heptose 1,7-bisphosphate phosphatase
MDAGINKAVFIDKDGTLIPDIPYNVDPNLVHISADTIRGLQHLHDNGYKLIIISNQPGIARGYFSEKSLEGIWIKINEILAGNQLAFDAFYYCPHDPLGSIDPYSICCNCRKPAPGLLLRAAGDWNIALNRSWMVGDILNDIEAGNSAGCRSILINNGNETEWIINPQRIPLAMIDNFEQAAQFIVKHDKYERSEFELHGHHQFL